jgi:cytochrome c-type biogenesis protein CcmH/NrfF
VLPIAVTSAVAWFFPAAFLLIGGGMIAMALKARRRRIR